MKIELTKIRIEDLFEGYKDSQEEGVVAYGGRLDVRPKYQREFVYRDEQRNAVIHTVLKGFPLNVMYWAKKDGGNFEVLDGQQRTISICQYLNHDFSIQYEGMTMYIDTWTEDKRQKFLDYELMIYICEGGDAEKLDWFRTINIAGEKLSDQELRNAVYSGTWLTQAKRYFSKTGCAAFKMGEKYVTADVIRQGLLEKALRWVSNARSQTIEEYMAMHQHDEVCSDLWEYYRSVIEWVHMLFIRYRREMRSVDWGELYLRFHQERYDSQALEQEVARLMADEDVSRKAGIYKYVLTREECWLNIRAFSPGDKRTAYERQNSICPICHKTFPLEEMEADHIVPWSKGGRTSADNCQCLCRECNRAKSNN